MIPYLTNLPAPYTFTPNHTKSNVRFALGYSAVAISAFTFYADRTLGWEATTSPWIIAAVVSYFILNSALTYWIWGVEAGEVFYGTRKSGETVCCGYSSFIRCVSRRRTNIHRSRFPPLPKSTRFNTRSTSNISLPPARSCRISTSKLPSQHGSRLRECFTQSPFDAGWRVRLMF